MFLQMDHSHATTTFFSLVHGTLAVPLFLYYHQAVYLADGIMSKLLLYAAVVFNAILSRIKSSVSDSCTSNALISGRTMILRMQRSTIMVCFALVGYFVGHVEAQLYTNSTVSWDDFAVGTMFTKAVFVISCLIFC